MYKHHAHHMLVVAVLISFTSAASSTVEQVYPKGGSYSCHCPNIKLKCTFSENPFTAFWSVLSGRNPENVMASTAGHTVDSSNIQSGNLFLEIKDTMYSKDNSYSCTAVYPDRSTEVSKLFPIPMVEDLAAPIQNLAVLQTKNTLNVQWDHDYYLCRNFTIYLNDTAVPECINTTALNCIIGNLSIGVQYEMRIVATESGTDPIESSQTIIMVVTDGALYCVAPGVTIWLLLAVTFAGTL